MKKTKAPRKSTSKTSASRIDRSDRRTPRVPSRPASPARPGRPGRAGAVARPSAPQRPPAPPRPSHPTRPRHTPDAIETMVNGSTMGMIDASSAWDPSGRTANQPWDLLRAPLEKAGCDPEAVLPRLRHFAAMLVSWNQSFSNLISKNDESRVVSRHLLESLEPAHWLKSSKAKRWLDLGSGGGLPAVPLHLAGVGESWSLVESRRTKTLFLRRVAQVMELPRIDVLNARLETLIEEGGIARAYDGFTSRATLPLGPTLELAAHCVVKGGEAFLWKGSGHAEEMEADPSWQGHWSHEGVLPIGDGQTVVVRFKRA